MRNLICFITVEWKIAHATSVERVSFNIQRQISFYLKRYWYWCVVDCSGNCKLAFKIINAVGSVAFSVAGSVDMPTYLLESFCIGTSAVIPAVTGPSSWLTMKTLADVSMKIAFSSFFKTVQFKGTWYYKFFVRWNVNCLVYLGL